MRLIDVFERYFTLKLPSQGMIMIPSGTCLGVSDADRSLPSPNLPPIRARKALLAAHRPLDVRAERLWYRYKQLHGALTPAL